MNDVCVATRYLRAQGVVERPRQPHEVIVEVARAALVERFSDDLHDCCDVFADRRRDPPSDGDRVLAHL